MRGCGSVRSALPVPQPRRAFFLLWFVASRFSFSSVLLNHAAARAGRDRSNVIRWI
jgi:hypothetical protein